MDSVHSLPFKELAGFKAHFNMPSFLLPLSPSTHTRPPSTHMGQGYKAMLQECLEQKYEAVHSSHRGADSHPGTGAVQTACLDRPLELQFPGSVEGSHRLSSLFLLLRADLGAKASEVC